MSGHTPGPWTVRDRFDVYAYTGWLTCSLKPESGDKGEANARLIAAAPEMLEALRGLELRATGLNRDMCVACGIWVAEKDHKPLCEIAVARAAIAKAEGRQP